MKAQKIIATIRVEVLSMDTVPCMVKMAVDNILNEFESGELEADDGDAVYWTIHRKPVVF
jgi:hypothetical protein